MKLKDWKKYWLLTALLIKDIEKDKEMLKNLDSGRYNVLHSKSTRTAGNFSFAI